MVIIRKKFNTETRDMEKTTKYYRAQYQTCDTVEDEVYISEDLQHAYDYAKGMETDDRTLMEVLEYDELLDALL